MEKHDYELNLMNDDVKLLYDIRDLMRQQNEMLNKFLNGLNREEAAEKTYKCKVCGTNHENTGQLLACAKKHKKEANNDNKPKV